MFTAISILFIILSIAPTIFGDVKLWSMDGYTLYQTKNNTQQNDPDSMNIVPANFESANLSYSGGYVTVWNNNGDLPIQAQFYDKNGVKSGKNVNLVDHYIKTYYSFLSIASLYNNEEDRFIVIYNIYDATTQWDEIICEIFTGNKSIHKWVVVNGTQGNWYLPQVIAFHDYIVVSYSDNYLGVWYKFYDNSGNQKGLAVQASPPNSQNVYVYAYASKLVKRGDNFVVVWCQYSGQGSDSSNCSYRNFNATGSTSKIISVGVFASQIKFDAIALIPSNNLVIAVTNPTKNNKAGSVITYNSNDIQINKFTNSQVIFYNLLPCNDGFFSFFYGYTTNQGDCSTNGCLISQFFDGQGKVISEPYPTGKMTNSADIDVSYISSASFVGNSASSDFSVTWPLNDNQSPSNLNIISGQFKLVKATQQKIKY